MTDVVWKLMQHVNSEIEKGIRRYINTNASDREKLLADTVVRQGQQIEVLEAEVKSLTSKLVK